MTSLFNYNVKILRQAIVWTIADVHSPKSWATLNGEIVDPEITVKIEMRDVLKVHDAQT